MAREITLAGYRLTYDEWRALGDEGRAELLRAFALDDAAARSRDARASYRLLESSAPPIR